MRCQPKGTKYYISVKMQSCDACGVLGFHTLDDCRERISQWKPKEAEVILKCIEAIQMKFGTRGANDFSSKIDDFSRNLRMGINLIPLMNALSRPSIIVPKMHAENNRQKEELAERAIDFFLRKIPAQYVIEKDDLLLCKANKTRRFLSCVWSLRHFYDSRHILTVHPLSWIIPDEYMDKGGRIFLDKMRENIVRNHPNIVAKGARYFDYLLLEKDFFGATVQTMAFSTFYVGKGTGDRNTSHFGYAKKVEKENLFLSGRKVGLINRLWKEGKEVGTLRFMEDQYEPVAFAIEACLIDFFSLHELANERGGDWSTVNKYVDWQPIHKQAVAIHSLCEAWRASQGNAPGTIAWL